MELLLIRCLMRSPEVRVLKSVVIWPAKPGRDFTRGGQSLSQKPHQVGAGKIQHAVLEEAGREPLQSSGTEYDISCPFTLVHGPVIIRLKLAEDLIVQWVEAPRERRQFVFPVSFHLVVEKLLGARIVFNPGEAVILSNVAQAFLVHTPGQPFPAIDVDMNTERKPGLNARVHPAQFRVDQVMVKRQAGVFADHHMYTLMLKSGGQFTRTEDADVAAGNTPFSGDLACPFILIDVTATQVLHGKFLF